MATELVHELADSESQLNGYKARPVNIFKLHVYCLSVAWDLCRWKLLDHSLIALLTKFFHDRVSVSQSC